jgi:hypothetical protein
MILLDLSMKILKYISLNPLSILEKAVPIFLLSLIIIGMTGISDGWDDMNFLIYFGFIVLLVLFYEIIRTVKMYPSHNTFKSVQDEIKRALTSPEFKFKDSKEVVNVLADFGEFIAELKDSEDGSMAYYDVKKLPHPKEKILKAFSYGLQFPDIDYKENVKVVLYSLPYFQKNVGEKPIYIFNSKLGKEFINSDTNDIKKIKENAEKFLGDEKTQKKKLELDKIFEIELAYYRRMIDNLGKVTKK